LLHLLFLARHAGCNRVDVGDRFGSRSVAIGQYSNCLAFNKALISVMIVYSGIRLPLLLPFLLAHSGKPVTRILKRL
jgi:hypothetical protein